MALIVALTAGDLTAAEPSTTWLSLGSGERSSTWVILGSPPTPSQIKRSQESETEWPKATLSGECLGGIFKEQAWARTTNVFSVVLPLVRQDLIRAAVSLGYP